MTEHDVEKLYALKGEIVARGVRAITGIEMPVYPKRRFQHGALPAGRANEEFPAQDLTAREANYRRQFLALYPRR